VKFAAGVALASLLPSSASAAVTPTQGTPASASTPLQAFAATIAPGAIGRFPSPSLAERGASGSFVFDPPAAAARAGLRGVHMLDWASMMDHDPVSRCWFAAGGRPRESALTQKMVWYDERTDAWKARDQWSGVGGGHIYRSTTVVPEHRRVAYSPLGTDTIELWDIDAERHAGSIPKPSPTIGGFGNAWTGPSCLTWFPEMGSRGALLFTNASRNRIVAFDWARQAWTAVGSVDGTWDNLHIAGHRHPLTAEVIVGASSHDAPRRLAIVDAQGRIRLTAPAPCSNLCGGRTRGMFFPHPSRAASIVFCHNTKRIWSYEWADDEWIDRAPVPPAVDSTNVIALVSQTGVLIARYGSQGGTSTWFWKPGF
jgi:hypothetical protein